MKTLSLETLVNAIKESKSKAKKLLSRFNKKYLLGFARDNKIKIYATTKKGAIRCILNNL